MQAINIQSEVRKLVADCVERGEVHPVNYYVDIVMANHPAIEGDDADFYLICARHRVKEIVSVTIGKFKPRKDASNRQLVLDGFEHLQIAYTFVRRGQTFLVPLDQCTDLELEMRAREYEEMAAGCRSHARELREYISARTATAA